LYADRQSHNVGTGDPALELNSYGRGTSFDTPSLRGLWATQPYLRDATATTLADVLRSREGHVVVGRITDEEVVDLIAFLRLLN
jgi:cytochrome c peroxidase